MKKPHVHAALIKAWADGAVIQRCGSDNVWRECKQNPMVWYPEGEYRVKPDKTNVEQYGVKEGDVWLVNGERLLFKGVCQSTGIDCISLADGTFSAFGWDWTKFRKEGVLLFRAGVVNKL